MLKISSSATSNIGKNIRTNEDNFYMNGIFLSEENNTANAAVYNDSLNRRIQFYAVFDGIGNDVKSDVTPNTVFSNGQYSSYVCANLLSRLQKYLKTKQEYNLDNYAYNFMRNANKEICNYMKSSNTRTGASFALLCLERRGMIRAYNMGNSKIFMLRDNRIIQLSQNDTQVESLVLAKEVSADIARHSPENKVLTQHLGIFEHEKEINMHINNRFTLRHGDKFLLCTDALCDYLTNSRIYQILSRDISEQEIVNDFMTEAMQNGGGNNLTVVVVGASQVEDINKKKVLLQPNENEVTNFTPLRYKKAFSIKPRHIKQAGILAVCVLLCILAIVFAYDLFFGDRNDEESNGDPPTAEHSQKSDVPEPTEPTADGTTAPVQYVPYDDDDDETTLVPPPLNDEGAYVQRPTEAPTRATVAPTPPPQTAAPTAPPQTTAAPNAETTAEPVEPPTEEVTEAKTPPPEETTTDAPEKITEPPPPETDPPTEAPTPPPPTNPPPDPTVEAEPTIGAE